MERLYMSKDASIAVILHDDGGITLNPSKSTIESFKPKPIFERDYYCLELCKKYGDQDFSLVATK